MALNFESEVKLPSELSAPAELTPDEIKNSFSAEVQKSRELLASNLVDEKPKRGRGRPKKSDLAAAQAMPGEGHPHSTHSTLSQVAAPPPLPPAVLALALQCPFLIAEKRTGFEGFRLNKDELDALVPQLDQVCRQYMPMLNTPHAALAVFGMSMATVAVTKYMLYLDFQAQLNAKNSENKINEEINPEKPF